MEGTEIGKKKNRGKDQKQERPEEKQGFERLGRSVEAYKGMSDH